jgi:cold shock CspA family protein
MVRRQAKAAQPQEVRGRPSTGRIATITRGRGDGFIRERSGERLYFNRRDVIGQGFNDLDVGDAVTFEVIEDHVSGHRAIRVAKKKA